MTVLKHYLSWGLAAENGCDLPFETFPKHCGAHTNSEHSNVCQVFLVGNDNASEEAK